MTELLCPSGHPVRVSVTRAKGRGRLHCSVCGWDDSQSVAGPQKGSSEPTRGVTIVGRNREPVEIVGAPARGIEIVRRP